jgi:hypothetical protein
MEYPVDIEALLEALFLCSGLLLLDFGHFPLHPRPFLPGERELTICFRMILSPLP